MLERLTLAILFATFMLAAPLGAQPAEPAPRERGRVLTEEGVEQLGLGNKEAALDRFLEADALLETSRSALRVATALEGLGRYREAVSWAGKVHPRATPENDPDEAARREATELLARAQQSMGKLSIVAPASVRSVGLDGEEVPLASGRATVAVDPGTHELVSESSSGEERRTVIVSRGGSSEVDLSPAPRAHSDPPARKSAALPRWPFIVGGSGVILGAVAGGLAGSGAMETSELYDLCPEQDGLPTCASKADVDEADDIQNGILVRHGVAIGCAAAGGALLLTGIIGLATGATSNEPRLGVAPAISPDQIGFLVAGRFQ